MAATKGLLDRRILVRAAAFADPEPVPEVRRHHQHHPAGVLDGVTTLLYGMIGMVGIRIWVENKVNFDKPLNVMVAAITMIIAIGQFAFAFSGISFNGIAIGTDRHPRAPTTA